MVIYQPLPQQSHTMESPPLINLEELEQSADKLEPQDFIVASEPISSKSLRLLKELYDLTKCAESDEEISSALQNSLPLSSASKKTKRSKKDKFSSTEIPLSSLITDNFDEDQIWEELQLQNGIIYDALVSSISKVLAHKPRTSYDEEEQEESDEETILKDLAQEEDDEDDEDDELSDFFESDEKYRKKKAKQQQIKTKYSKSVVDDKFFNLAQMTEFVEKMEADEETKPNDDDDESEEDIDYFKASDNEEKEGDDDREDEEDYYYKDFFDPPHETEGQANLSADKTSVEKSVRFNLENEDKDINSEEEKESKEMEPLKKVEENPQLDEQTLSNFEKRRRKIEDNIKVMEEQALQPKSWQLTGEVTAETRPENSLLEEHLLYDHLLRQAPEITVKTTQRLEDIIKQRIKDQAWDDVIRKIKPIEGVAEYKKRLVLDAEKSKISLTEIYEKEYVEKQKGSEEKTEEEKQPEEHLVIQKDMQSLFAKLDALSHFHYTPKAPVPEIKTITNAAATSVEEITPSTFSEARLLAPQEILEPAKGEIKGHGERSSTDKKRERRLKKKKQHIKRLVQEEKARAKGLGLRNIKLAESVVKKSKKNAEDEAYQRTKELKSSKAFFTKLQEQVTTHIDKVGKRKNKTAGVKTSSAKKYKL